MFLVVIFVFECIIVRCSLILWLVGLLWFFGILNGVYYVVVVWLLLGWFSLYVVSVSELSFQVVGGVGFIGVVGVDDVLVFVGFGLVVLG